MVRAAILGLGRWGRSFVRSVAGKTDDIRFVAALTRTPAKAQAFCDEVGLPMATSYEAILSDPAIDAVVLATPHSQHEAQVKAAAAAGKHILVEKPMALTRASAEAQVAAARDAGVLLAVGFNRRFHPSICALREHVKDGRLGALVGMVGQHTSGIAPFIAAGEWRMTPEESPGGAITGVGVHTLDHMIELGGKVETVRAVTSRRGVQCSDDTTAILLRFASGLTATMFCSLSTAPNLSFTVYGTKGLAEVSAADLSAFRFVPMPVAMPDGPVTAPPPERQTHAGFDMQHAELVAFARAIREGTPYPVAIEDVLHGMSVFDAIVASTLSGREEPVA